MILVIIYPIVAILTLVWVIRINMAMFGVSHNTNSKWPAILGYSLILAIFWPITLFWLWRKTD